MRLFSKRPPQLDLTETARKIAQTLRQLSPILVEGTLKSGDSYVRTHFPQGARHFPDYSKLSVGHPTDISQIPSSLQTTVTFLNTYLLWCVGAFLNGQRIMNGRLWKQFIDTVRSEIETISVPSEIDPFLEHLKEHETDKMQLSGRLLSALFSNAGLYPVVFAEGKGPPPIFQIDIQDQIKMERYHIPLMELISGFVALAIDRLFRPDKVSAQVNLIKTYESEVRSQYKIDLTEVHKIISL